MTWLKPIFYNYIIQSFFKMKILHLQWLKLLLTHFSPESHFYIPWKRQKMIKKGYLRNWRPISLLCSDYKILTEILSNRLKTTLAHTIFKEQTCGIPDRSIFSNLFTIHEVITHGSKKKIKHISCRLTTKKLLMK